MSSQENSRFQQELPTKQTSIREVLKDLRYGVKVLLAAFVAWNLIWIFLFGQPKHLLGIPAAIYQGFNCGWSSEVVDPWTCDK